ncbi:AAA family ATPase [Polaribacter sp. Z022]|uniref:AAA family ATPase n=1 Tax=Polaribacter sp. Z022 TaxID=2927125 RepID=UPI0020224427|nr:AAA family ATPase [Polaribacter sp. Z022]MCL7753295.1 AAA family ATPase [Polaribacter sp. Z022]
MSNIPNNINKEHIISAIQEIDNKGIYNSRRNATEYALLFSNKEYPPKYVISIANKYVNNEELNSNDFNSIQSRTFLTNLGFECIKKTNSLKRNFAKWLLDKGQTSYKQYLGDTIKSVEFRLDEIDNFFLEKDLFLPNKNNFDEIKTYISYIIYGKSRSINEAFFEYNDRNGNGIPQAILGRQNYFAFLNERTINKSEDKFTWVKTHLAIANYLKDTENEQPKLIEVLKDAGVTGFSDRDANNVDIDLEVIDPFTFFCYINKYGDSRRLQILQNISEQLNIHYPKDEFGIPSSNAQKVWMFPYKELRVNNEIERLWSFFFQVLNDEINNDSFEDLLQIRGIAITKLTEALFNVNPIKYFPINGPTKPYLKSVFSINPKFKTFDDYKNILKQLQLKTDKPFYQLSYEAWLWNEEQKNNNIMEENTISSLKEEYIEYLDGYADSTIDIYSTNFVAYLEYYVKKKNISTFNQENFIELSKVSRFEFGRRTSFEHKGKGYSNFIPFFNEKLANSQDLNSAPVNQILYGPPGTGKTYKTKELAIKIIDNTTHKSRTTLNNRYKELVEQGQIVFTTFHQSMSYEDFVEGIKPKTENNNVTYEVEDGIFKLLSNKAKGVEGTIKTNLNNVDFKNCNYFKMSLGGKNRKDVHDWCIDNNQIALGYGGNNDLNKITSKDWKNYKKEFQNLFPEEVEKSSYSLTATHAFKHWMKEGDVVLVSLGNNIIDAIGVIEGDYDYKESSDFPYHHFRNVRWIATNLNANPSLFVDKKISQQTIYQFNNDDINIDYLENTFTNRNTEEKNSNYVLIVDEINRGNISSIFGELITLLEEDKRLKSRESITVKLPYSKDEFGIPKNLYIIGTMNTADRSVEALDTALRRRFSFTEVAPNSTLLEGKKIEEIELEILLTTINDRIEILIDKDHKIGHSYFLNIETLDDLKDTFKNKVIPLLEEYFFGDYGKIGLVLGDKFIKLKEESDKVSFAKNFTEKYEDAENLREKAVYAFTDEDSWKASSFTSIYDQ